MRSLSEIIKANREAYERSKRAAEATRKVLDNDMVKEAVGAPVVTDHGTIIPDREAVNNSPGIQPWSKPGA